MSVPRYFLPEHPEHKEVYSKSELRGMLQAGELSRSDMVTDDETGIHYLLGDLLAMPFREAAIVPMSKTIPPQPTQPTSHEFRADTPLPQPEREEMDEDELDEKEEAAETEDDTDEEDEIGTNAREVEEEEQEQEHGDGIEERLLYVGHPSWLAFPKSLFITALCIGSAIFFQQHGVRLEWITLLGSIAGLILLFIGLDRTSTTYLVTTRRVEMEYGIIGRNSKELRIGDIRTIDVLQRGFGAMLGLGTVKFESTSGTGLEVSFRNVRRAHDLKQLVRELQG